MKYLYLLILFILAGCSSTGVVIIGENLYMIGQRSAQMGIGRPVGVIGDVYKEASDFCKKDNKDVATVELLVQDTFLARPGSVELHFKCQPRKELNVDKN